MKRNYSRRAVVVALFGSVATGIFADAPLTSLRPMGRPQKAGAITPEMRVPLIDVIRASGVTGRVSAVLADATTGEIIDSSDGNEPLPPASVTKVVTALYALEYLGPEFQFQTRVFADGPILDGVLDGNLILAGGGNPNLVTDDLAQLATRLKDSGLTAVRGKFYVYTRSP